MLLSALLAAVLAQAQPDRTVSGTVVDDQGKPVAGARVVLYAPPLNWGKENTAESATTTDDQGRYRVKIPPLGRYIVGGVNLLVYRPGLTIAAHPFFRHPEKIVLRQPEPRAVRVEGPDGRPVARARIAPKTLSIFSGTGTVVPESLSAPLAVTTDPDGRATLGYLTARDQLAMARVTTDSIGTQDIVLVERPGRGSTEPVITIRLRKTSRLTGRIVDDAGNPVSGQVVEIWSRGGGAWLRPDAVELAGGPLRTAADGSFQTPDNLFVGSAYRAVVRASGKDTILSDWITIGEQPRALLPMRLGSLRTIGGRVVDRQGKPVAGVEVFQTADGPEPTATKSGPDGRFTLPGFRRGPVFLFARGDGFRFHGQLIRDGKGDVTVELTRTGEPPTRAMPMLTEPMPLEESRAMARRLVEPVWKVVVETGDDRTKYRTLAALVNADPAGVLEKLESARFSEKGPESRLRVDIVVAMAASDPEEALAVAEAIADPRVRAAAIIRAIDTLPDSQRGRKVTLLDRAALHARATPDPVQRLREMGDVAARLYDLGEVARSKALFSEAQTTANRLPDKTDTQRGAFAGQLALVDLPAAMAIARDFETSRTLRRSLFPLAYRLMEKDPAYAERIWKEFQGGVVLGAVERLCWKMATVDPQRARRILDAFPWNQDPGLCVFLALGAWKRDETAARQALDEGIRRMDRLMQGQPERSLDIVQNVLPAVERIDPKLVPEFFWRGVALRPPTGNPRTTSAYSPAFLIEHLAWYDREVAAALFEPSRQRIEQTDDRDLATWNTEFLAWSLFDPRAAVARLERIPVSRDPAPDANAARLVVADSLGRTYGARWRDIWRYWTTILDGGRRAF